jgi:hypothetical protein
MSVKYRVDYQVKEDWGEDTQMTHIYEYTDETTTVADVLQDFYKSHNENVVTGITIRKMEVKGNE